jgi:serine phosphatase RsbU (regulator of sigma subunit)
LQLLLGSDEERQHLQTAMDTLKQQHDRAEVLPVHLQGQPRLLAISRIADPELYVVSALDLEGSAILDRDLIIGAAVGGASLLALLILFATFGIDRLVLRPLTRLTASAREIANGRYDVRLSSRRNDELGELTRAFDSMSQRVREHTELLEQRVAERTREVTEAHTILAETHHKLTDSIRYASLIQTAILPSQQLAHDFPGEHFVLWAPRDVVGGDLYLYRRQIIDGQEGHLVGIVDCAGHGVPGAFMTMIAHAALDLALRDTPANDPAAVLARVDGVVRQMLPTQQERFNRIVTSMDMGLCWIAAGSANLTFAGAHINLYRYRNGDCQAWQGHRRGIGERRPGQYANHTVDGLGSDTFYLTTDGYLDQAGGSNGFGMGEGEFMRWIASTGAAPLADQEAALRQHLAGYQGPHPQRDDITVLAFRLP